VSRDLRHICGQSGVGAVIEAARIPIHADAQTMSRRSGRSSLDHALHDGEDHELLFTATRLPPTPSVHPIGHITEDPATTLRHADDRHEPLVAQGWEHAL
jgi:thiamine-monophosphate kinase